MSNTIGSNLINQRLLEHHTRINTSPCISSGNYTLFRLQATSRSRKLPLSTKFRLNVSEKRLPMSSNRLVMPRAVLTTDSPSEVHSLCLLN